MYVLKVWVKSRGTVRRAILAILTIENGVEFQVKRHYKFAIATIAIYKGKS